ncbi:aminotransferase class V-fold PLP-dependent enzyme [Phytohabitans flavus]|uniref:aminotransferase class V-fold PLP-dependent enzyme n=1 Tax=Phytohabitans flavus TaxID=1076124 RepID=UPI0036275449
MRRRSLLGVAAAAGLVGAATACEDEPAAAPAPAGAPPLIPTDWASVRAQFAISREIAHLSTYVFASHPAPVRESIERHRTGLDADAISYLHENEVRLDERVAVAAADYLDARLDDIAFTDSATMGLGLLYSGLRLAPGDEVLTTEHDFYATHESLRLRAERDGVTVRRVRLYADPATASTDEIVGSLTRAVTGRTKVVALTWVHSSTGVKLPIRAIADALRGRGVLLCVDGVHGFGAEDASPGDLGCDFLVSGCHKWLLGPRGTGLVWGSASGWASFAPLIPRSTGAASARGSGSTAAPRRPARRPPRAATTALSTGGRSPRRSSFTRPSGASGSLRVRTSWPPRSRTDSPVSASSSSRHRRVPTSPPAWSAARCPTSTSRRRWPGCAVSRSWLPPRRTGPRCCASAPRSPTTRPMWKPR